MALSLIQIEVNSKTTRANLSHTPLQKQHQNDIDPNVACTDQKRNLVTLFIIIIAIMKMTMILLLLKPILLHEAVPGSTKLPYIVQKSDCLDGAVVKHLP